MTEKILHTQICKYLDMQYPNLIYTSDMSGMRVSIGLRVEMQRKRTKSWVIPDLLILHPNNEFKGLFLELKLSLSDVWKKDGKLKKSEHLEAQEKSLNRLQELGYQALFGCGFDHTKNIIDSYLKAA